MVLAGYLLDWIYSGPDTAMCLTFSAFCSTILIGNVPVPVLTQRRDVLTMEASFTCLEEFRILRRGDFDRYAAHPHFF